MVLCNNGWSTVGDIKNVEDHILLFMASQEIAERLSKRQTLKGLKLAQQYKVCKGSIAMCSEGKPVSGFMATEKARHFYDGIT
jgi:hypothetical protein